MRLAETRKKRIMFISIIIPVLNEEKSVKALLQQLQIYRQQGHEVIVVDGGSDDETVSISKPIADKVITSDSGRARQMNKGVAESTNEVLWFLHADTSIPENVIETIKKSLNKYDWGRFNIELSGPQFIFRIIEKMINIRSCLSGVATGDQGIFVNRKIFDSVGGYSEFPLMEDVALSKKLKTISQPACIKETLTTSSRRWEKSGIIKTILLMWYLRFLYWIGVTPDKLAKLYR